MDWEDLRVFLGVARAGSFKGASRTLGIDKATVGRRVASLEDDLSVRLLDRRASGCVLTARGREVLDAAAKADLTLAALTDSLAGSTVRMTAPLWFTEGVLLPRLAKLVECHPKLEVVFVPTTAVVNLAQREADIAIRNVLPDQASMTARKLGELGSTLYASKKAALPASRADMAEHRVVGYETALTFVPPLRWLATTGARVALRVTDTLALATAIEEGIGLGVLPCFVGDARSSLVRVPFAGVHRERIWAVVPTELKTAPGVRAMLDFVVAAFKTEATALAGRG